MKNNIKCLNKFTFFGNNINGMWSKRESLIKNIHNFQIGVFNLQETKVSEKGKLRIPNYVIFELLRENKGGGSLMIGVHTNLDPVLIFEDSFLEIMVVQIKINNYMIQIINACGLGCH